MKLFQNIYKKLKYSLHKSKYVEEIKIFGRNFSKPTFIVIPTSETVQCAFIRRPDRHSRNISRCHTPVTLLLPYPSPDTIILLNIFSSSLGRSYHQFSSPSRVVHDEANGAQPAHHDWHGLKRGSRLCLTIFKYFLKFSKF